MEIRVAKYTKVIRSKRRSRPTRYGHIIRMCFSHDPAKIFKCDYFRLVEIEKNSIYELQPAAENERYRSRISIEGATKSFPFLTTFDNVVTSEMISNINDFGQTDAIKVDITNTGIRFLLPEIENRNKVSVKTNSTTEIKTSVVKNPPPLKPSIASIRAETAPIASTVTLELFKRTMDQLNDMVVKLESTGIKIKLRLEENLVKANTDL